MSNSDLLGRVKAFVPDSVFDAHAHIYDAAFMKSYADRPEHVFGWPKLSGAEVRAGLLESMSGKNIVGALLIPAPDPLMCVRGNGLRELSTGWVVRELNADAECFGEVFVLPGDTEADIESMLVHERIRGFKCYWYASPNGMNAPAAEFLPETAWAVADRYGLVITLHLVCDDALSNEGNLAYIETMARRYPKATLILAHAGRAFAAWTNLEPVRRLAMLDNICYDLSAICESAPMQACIKAAGPDRVMWGSDYPCCRFVGRPVSFADTFVWFDESAACGCGFRGQAFNVLEESLIALYIASDLMDLTGDALERLFRKTAQRVIAKVGG